VVIRLVPWAHNHDTLLLEKRQRTGFRYIKHDSEKIEKSYNCLSIIEGPLRGFK
jgi:hypothetical protein